MDSVTHVRADADGPLCVLARGAQYRGMMHFSGPIPIPSISDALADHVRLAAIAYLGRFKGSSREHTESNLRCYLSLVCRARPGSAGRAPPGSGAVLPVDAGGPPAQAVHG